jgi:hypothetical protein
MPDDDGFERDLVKGLNNEKITANEYLAYRKKQHRFASQDIDVLVDSKDPMFYMGIECKSKQVDVEKTSKDSNTTEDKLYFSQAFSKDKNGVSQVKRITCYLYKTGRPGALAVAYRRGRGRPVHYYGLHWDFVWKRFQQGESGLPKSLVEEKGELLMEAGSKDEVTRKTDTKFHKIFNLQSIGLDYSQALQQG